MESTGDHEYHVLEEANVQLNRSISDPLMASDPTTSVKVDTSREQILSESKQSPVVFDDPLYSSFTNEKKGTEEQSRNADGSDVNKLNTLSEGKPLVAKLCNHAVSNASHDQNPPMLFDDPRYSVLPPDKRSTATPSQMKVDGSDEQCHPPEADNTVKPDEPCFDDVQES